MMTTHRVTISGGAKVWVEEAGEGPAILLLHAGVADRTMWDRQWAWLSQGFRVIRWDWRGFGDSEHVAGPYSYAADVLAIMDTVKVGKAILVGASMAGSVAIQVAVQHPERVLGLVLVGTGVPGFHGENPAAVEALFLEADRALTSGDAGRYLALMESLWLIGPARLAKDVDPVYLTTARSLLLQTIRPQNEAVSQDDDWSSLDFLAALLSPVLIIVGDQDVPEVVRGSEYLESVLPRGRREVVENTAHLPNLERPRYFDALLSDWLAEVDWTLPGVPVKPMPSEKPRR